MVLAYLCCSYQILRYSARQKRAFWRGVLAHVRHLQKIRNDNNNNNNLVPGSIAGFAKPNGTHHRDVFLVLKKWIY